MPLLLLLHLDIVQSSGGAAATTTDDAYKKVERAAPRVTSLFRAFSLTNTNDGLTVLAAASLVDESLFLRPIQTYFVTTTLLDAYYALLQIHRAFIYYLLDDCKNDLKNT